MALLVCLAGGMLTGFCFGGWNALRYARRHEFKSASRSLQWGSLAAGGFAMACTTVTLGWPLKESESSVSEEVTRTVMRTVDVPVTVTRWFFFKTTKIEAQQVEEDVTDIKVTTTKVRQFSVCMLIPMLLVGLVGSWIYRWSIQLMWRWFP